MDLASVVGGGFGLGLGAVSGYMLGRWLRCRGRLAYWSASAAFLIGGVILIFLGHHVGAGLMAGGGVGLVTGGLNGVKYGAGKMREWRGDSCDRADLG